MSNGLVAFARELAGLAGWETVTDAADAEPMLDVQAECDDGRAHTCAPAPRRFLGRGSCDDLSELEPVEPGLCQRDCSGATPYRATLAEQAGALGLIEAAIREMSLRMDSLE